MGHKSKSEKRKHKKSRSKDRSKSKKKKSKEKSIEILSEEKNNTPTEELIIDDDNGEALTKRLSASIAKAKERKIRMQESVIQINSPTKSSADNSLIYVSMDEIPLPLIPTKEANTVDLTNIKLPEALIEEKEPSPPPTETPVEFLPPPPPPPPILSREPSQTNLTSFSTLPNYIPENSSNNFSSFPTLPNYISENPSNNFSPIPSLPNYIQENSSNTLDLFTNSIQQPDQTTITNEGDSTTSDHLSNTNPTNDDMQVDTPPPTTNSEMNNEETPSFNTSTQAPTTEVPQKPNPQPSEEAQVGVMKKPMMKLSLKISETSAALISSGIRQQTKEEPTSETKEETPMFEKKNKVKKSRWAVDDEEEEDEEKKSSDKKDSSSRKRSSKKSSSRSRSRSKKRSKKSRSRSKKRSKKSRSRSKKRSRRSRSRSRKKSKKSRRSSSRSRKRSRRSRSRSRRSKSRSRRSRSRSRRSRSRSRRSRSRSRRARSRSRRSRSRSRQSRKWRRDKRSPSEGRKELDNNLNIDKARLRQIALKNAFKMGLSTSSSTSSFYPNKPPVVNGDDDAKEGQSIKELTDFCKKIADVKDEDLDKIVEGGVVVVDEEEMPFIPARTNKEMRLQAMAAAKPQTLQEKLIEMANISSQFPVSRGNDHTNKPEAKEDAEAYPEDNMGTYKPLDKEALKLNNWVAPGQFIPTLPAKLPSLQLESGPTPDKDMFTKAPKVSGGIGKLMLMKLGWKEGEGLGKNKHGMTDPIPVNIKTDRKGFVWSEEDPDQLRLKALEKAMKQQAMIRQMAFMRQAQMMQQQRAMMMMNGGRPPLLPGGVPVLRMPNQPSPARQPLLPMPSGPRTRFPADTNYVMHLTQTCCNNRWAPPQFLLLEDTHPVTKAKAFKFKIILNGEEFVSPQSSAQKKQAKNDAALLCLQKLGIAS